MRCKLLLVSSILLLAGCAQTTTTTTTTNAPNDQATAQTATTTTVQTAASPQAAAVPGQPAAALPAAATTAPRDACTLLTSDDIKEVQGEAFKDAKLSQRTDSSFAVAQCFYSMPTFTKSISLELTQAVAGSKTSPRDFWKENFARAAAEGERDKDRDRDRGRDKDKDKDKDKNKDKDKDKDKDKERGRGGEEEEEGAPPTHVAGVGDDAYWVNSRVSGALYVLKGNSFIRLSLGGADTDEARQKKAKALAQKALARF
jgi:hypothetical protein